MRIDQLVEMAERMHDDEGWDLGSASTRETRNQFWARVIGCAHHGHPRYNPNPDKQWHLKKADASRPQTDDVATSMPSRSYWDCINGVGQDGYEFAVNAHSEPLSPSQIVYAPPVPAGSAPGPQPVQPYPDEVAWWGGYYEPEVAKLYQQAGKPFPDSSAAFRWFTRVAYDIRNGMTKEAAAAKHLADLRAALGLP